MLLYFSCVILVFNLYVIIIMFKKFGTPQRYAHCKRHTSELVVKPNLAITPSQMLDLASRGIPVTPANSNMFYDGSSNPSWDVELDRRRGADPVDMWNAERDIKGKVRKSLLSERKKSKQSKSE